FQRPVFAPFDERADRGGRGVENVDAMAFDHGPETIRLGKVWRAFVHHHGRAVRQWSIDHVAVARDPADVGGAPVDVFVLEIEYPLGCEMNMRQVTARRVQNSFWFTGR